MLAIAAMIKDYQISYYILPKGDTFSRNNYNDYRKGLLSGPEEKVL